MKKNVKVLSAFLAISLITNTFGTISYAESENSTLPEMIETDQVIVQLKEGAASHLENSDLLAIEENGADQLVTLKVPEDETIDAYMNELEDRDDVESVEPDHILQLDYVSNDPYISSRQYHHQKIGADKAWDKTQGSANITVAVIDDGIDLKHTDLLNQIVSPYDVVTKSFSKIAAGNHGTHVAGIVGSSIDNGLLGAGVAPKTSIMPINVFSGEGAYTSHIIEGIHYAVDNGAEIINLSLGNYIYSANLNNAIQYAYDNDVTIIAAAGNDSTNLPSYPASYDNVISVGSTTENDRLSAFSNFGKDIDLTAPGSSIFSTLPNNSFGSMSGTSMASPIVAGVAALILANEPHLSNEEVADRLYSTADDLGSAGFDYYYGNGRVNAKKALLIKDKTVLEVQAVNDSSREVTGYIPYEIENVKITVYNQSGTVLGAAEVHSGLVDFTIAIPQQTAGTILYITVSDNYGKEIDRVELSVSDMTPPAVPIVESVTDKSFIVNGVSEIGSSIAVKTGLNILGTANTNNEGKFSVEIPLQKAGTRLTLTATDRAGNVSEAIEIPVQGKIYTEKNTSRLGHLNSANVRIYENYDNQPEYATAGADYTHEVYYIKKQVIFENEIYYLISRNPSSITGVVGWVKASDMSTHPHVKTDSKAKIYFLKGTGNAYTKAWGGKKNLAFNGLAGQKGKAFAINLTEKVGENIWYRGVINGKTAWVQESQIIFGTENATSRLGHLNSANVRIYENYAKQANYQIAGTEYTNAVYYIKKQAKFEHGTYYLISQNPSSTRGAVGWVKASDMSTHPHLTDDKKVKTFYLNGSGKAYMKAWGGSKDSVYSNLSAFKNREFKVHLTESVGSSVWYRGELNGKTVWIHSSYVASLEESKTSKLGHIRSSKVKIYPKFGNESTALTAGGKYTHAVYYIKKEAILNGQKYYLLSNNPSSAAGVVGWAKEGDITAQAHLVVDKKAKTYYLKGTGSAYTKAWGGNKNLAFERISTYKNEKFEINLTEKVGNAVWHRGKLKGKTVWIHNSYLNKTSLSSTSKYPAPSTKTPGKYVNGILVVNKKYALPSNYNPGVNGTAQKGVNDMLAAAKAQGIKLNPISAYRSYSYQKNLYNNYVRTYGQARADRFSAKPGHSEHQTGLAFDFGGPNQTHWLEDSFAQTAEGKWLYANAHKYGFILRYPKGKESITGYMYEPWHYRYVGLEQATKIKNSGKTMEEYFKVSGK